MEMRLGSALAAIGAMSIVAFDVAGSSVHEGTWWTVRFEQMFPPPLERVLVEARLEKSLDRLEALEVSLGDLLIAIPPSAYSDLPKPQLQTLSVAYGPQVPEADSRYAVLEFYFGEPITAEPFDENCENRDRYSSVQIKLVGNRAVSRMIFYADRGGSSRFEKL